MNTGPLAAEHLTADLCRVGLGGRSSVLVHCSMRRIGWIDGGAGTLAAALRAACGPATTLVTPAQTTNNSTTNRVFRAKTADLGPTEIAAIEDEMPAFNAAATPSHQMGALAEHVRRLPGAMRSPHPQASFAAVGPAAVELMSVHDLDSAMGPRSPLAAMYASGGWIALIGVGYETCSAFHLAEHHQDAPMPTHGSRCYVDNAGVRERVDFVAPIYDDTDFAELGAAMEGECEVNHGYVGKAIASAFPLPEAVDFAIDWMAKHRSKAAMEMHGKRI